MRINQPLSGRERSFPAEQHLISATDTRGIITYCNDEFAECSGQLIPDTSIGGFNAIARSYTVGGRYPSFECSRSLL